MTTQTTMATYTVIGFHAGGAVVIAGESVADAIQRNWELIRRNTLVWTDGAGYTLRTSQVTAIRVIPPDPQTTRGGRHFATIKITLTNGRAVDHLAIVERPGGGPLPAEETAVRIGKD